MEPIKDPAPPEPDKDDVSVGLTIWFCFCFILLASGLIIWAWQAYVWMSTGTWPAVTVNGVLARVSLAVPEGGSDKVAWIADASMGFVLVLVAVALFAAAAPMVGKDSSKGATKD